MLGIKRITGAADLAPEGEPGSWVSDAAREKFLAAYERAFALWPQPREEFDIETVQRLIRRGLAAESMSRALCSVADLDMR
jgi:hypothetical protein